MKVLGLLRWIGCWPIAITLMWGAAALCGVIIFAVIAVFNLGIESAIRDRMWIVYAMSGWCGGSCGMMVGLKIAPSRGPRVISAMRILLSIVVAILSAGDVLAKDWMRLIQEVAFAGAIWTTGLEDLKA